MPTIAFMESWRSSRLFNWVSNVGFIFICTLAALTVSEQLANAAERPNVLLIFTDDQGWNDVGCYGSEIPTPNIDALAKLGVKFTQFYSASSICTPSRYGLLTGRFPTRSEDQLLGALMFLAEEDKDRGIRSTELTFPKALQGAGYRTALIGKWHLGHGDTKFWPTKHGFDSFFGHTGGCVDFFTLHYGTKPDWYRGEQIIAPGGYATDVIADEVVRFLKSQNEKPFFLQVSFNAPHFGKWGNIDNGDIVNKMQPKLTDLAKVPASIKDPLRRAFAAKVMGMDTSIGKILETLKDNSLSDKTLVIFLTDHGGDENYGGSNLPLRGGKATLFEGGLKVPCIARWPGEIEPGSLCTATTCSIDLFPTLLAIAGASASNELQNVDGRSLLPLFDNSVSVQEWNASRKLIWQTGNHAELGRKTWLAYREDKYKFVQPPAEPPMLFDLERDPNEQRDLASTMPNKLKAMLLQANSMLQSHRQ